MNEKSHRVHTHLKMNTRARVVHLKHQQPDKESPFSAKKISVENWAKTFFFGQKTLLWQKFPSSFSWGGCTPLLHSWWGKGGTPIPDIFRDWGWMISPLGLPTFKASRDRTETWSYGEWANWAVQWDCSLLKRLRTGLKREVIGSGQSHGTAHF